MSSKERMTPDRLSLLRAIGNDSDIANSNLIHELVDEIARNTFACPVCAWPWLTEEPILSYEICPQCGTEFGLTDADYDGTGTEKVHAVLRQQWIDGGRKWWSSIPEGITTELRKTEAERDMLRKRMTQM